MAFKKEYTKEDLKAFRINALYEIIKVLIDAFKDLNKGTAKDLDMKWVEEKTRSIIELAEKLVTEEQQVKVNEVEKIRKEALKGIPFPG